MTTDLTNVGRLENSRTSSLLSRSHITTDFEADETMMFSWVAKDKIADLWAFFI